jgi:dihydrofolate reductase
VKPRLIYSMSVSVDGFIADREGGFGWSVPSDELFRFHLDQVRGLGGCLLGRRLYETMLVRETDPSMRETELDAAFADVWCALPKVVFSRTLDSVQGNARLADASVAEEAAAALDATDKGCWSSSGVIEKNSISRAFTRADHRRGDWTTLRHDLPAPPPIAGGAPPGAVFA